MRTSSVRRRWPQILTLGRRLLTSYLVSTWVRVLHRTHLSTRPLEMTMRRPRTATFLLTGALALGTPVLAGCSEGEPATDEEVQLDVEELDDEAVPGVDVEEQ